MRQAEEAGDSWSESARLKGIKRSKRKCRDRSKKIGVEILNDNY